MCAHCHPAVAPEDGGDWTHIESSETSGDLLLTHTTRQRKPEGQASFLMEQKHTAGMSVDLEEQVE